MLVCFAPAALAAEDMPDITATFAGETVAETFAAQPNSLDTVYVSAKGNDDTGAGTKENPVASLATAVTAADDGATIYVMSDLTASSRALVSGKKITIEGNNHTVSRAEEFVRAQDQGRGGYHSAMIEVANQSELTLQNITLDDKFLREADEFTLAGPSTEDNTVKAHDGIISSYGDGHSTIILGEGATLKNFGGLSAVYITGEGGKGATLIMKSGSKICDDELGEREGGYAAVFNHGGTFTMESGASIDSIDGRAIYADNAGVTTVAGSIKNITSSDVVKNEGDAGVAYFGDGNTKFTLASGGVIEDIKSHNNTAADSALHLIGCTFITEKDSLIQNLSVGIADMNGATVDIAGSITNCNAKDVFFRLRGTQGTFILQQTGSITKCDADTALVYLNGGKPKIEIAGTIDDINVPVLFISNNGSRKDGTITLTETGVISNVTGYGMRLEDPSRVTIAGTITNCSSYALQYYPKSNQSLLTIKSTATIENNNNGRAQVRAQNTILATDAQEHIVIEKGAAINGNKTIDLAAFDVTLDEDYDAVKLGNASNEAVTAIKTAVENEHSDWTVVGSDAVWVRPSTENYHFTVERPSGVKKTQLYLAYVELKDDGTPVENAEVGLQSVKNAPTIDVTLKGLAANQSYALMFVNSATYVLAPDDITIYTGGGQGDENYDDGGFPALTINNSVDLKSNGDLTNLKIKGESIAAADNTLLDQLLENLEVTYILDGEPVTNDKEAGEYTVKLSWKNGLADTDVVINGNSVTLGEGTLIVRHIENVEEAQKGTNTYKLLNAEPTSTVENAVAIAKKGGWFGTTDPSFYTNDDENREVDAAGIQLLDDDLLRYEGENRQQPMEEKAEEHLGAPADGMAYQFDFHYLDLVDAYNGNAWVSASYGTTVYLPYPEGLTRENWEEKGAEVIHYKDLHREYGITGQEDIEAAIKACEMETMTVTTTEYGIKFDVAREGFSPFAIVWQDTKESVEPDDPTPPPYIPPVDPDEPADPDDTGVSDLLNTEDHIQYLFGYPDGTFGPENNMTRAEVAQMFYNLLLDQDVEITKTFDDVPTNAWYTKAVNTLASLDIISGVGDNKFEPERSITRAEFTAMAMKFAVGGEEGENIFSDVDEDDWFYDAVVNSIQYGWIHGYGDGTFRPNNPITRAEVTAIVNNMLGRAADEDFVDEHAEELTQFSDIEKHWAYYHIVEATNDHDYTKPSSGENWTKLN